jgi:hypothetical protein
MTTTRMILHLGVALFITTVTVAAQQIPPRPAPEGLTTSRTWTDDDLEKFMKQIGPGAANLRKLIDAQAAPAAEAQADMLEHFFDDVEEIFDARKYDDAEQWAQDASEYANHIEDAVEAKDFTKASEQLKLLMGQCQMCHAKYRERLPDGTYQLKKQP